MAESLELLARFVRTLKHAEDRARGQIYLYILEKQKPTRLTDLQDQIQLSESQLYRGLHRLASEGLIEKEETKTGNTIYFPA